jgi:hypothetical protein
VQILQPPNHGLGRRTDIHVALDLDASGQNSAGPFPCWARC